MELHIARNDLGRCWNLAFSSRSLFPLFPPLPPQTAEAPVLRTAVQREEEARRIAEEEQALAEEFRAGRRREVAREGRRGRDALLK